MYSRRESGIKRESNRDLDWNNLPTEEIITFFSHEIVEYLRNTTHQPTQEELKIHFRDVINQIQRSKEEQTRTSIKEYPRSSISSSVIKRSTPVSGSTVMGVRTSEAPYIRTSLTGNINPVLVTSPINVPESRITKPQDIPPQPRVVKSFQPSESRTINPSKPQTTRRQEMGSSQRSVPSISSTPSTISSKKGLRMPKSLTKRRSPVEFDIDSAYNRLIHNYTLVESRSASDSLFKSDPLLHGYYRGFYVSFDYDYGYFTNYFVYELRKKCRKHNPNIPGKYVTIGKELVKMRSDLNNIAVINAEPESIDKWKMEVDILKRTQQYVCDIFPYPVSRFILDKYRELTGDFPVSILDTSAGWGDRLIASYLDENVRRYVGIDPNQNMTPVYDNIVSSLRNYRDKEFTYTIHPTPFEDLENIYNHEFDLMFTSPPYFNIEEYQIEDENRAIHSRYNTIHEFFEGFIVPSMRKIASMVKVGGLIMIIISDTGLYKLTRYFDLACSAAGFTFIELIPYRVVYDGKEENPQYILVYQNEMRESIDTADIIYELDLSYTEFTGDYITITRTSPRSQESARIISMSDPVYITANNVSQSGYLVFGYHGDVFVALASFQIADDVYDRNVLILEYIAESTDREGYSYVFIKDLLHHLQINGIKIIRAKAALNNENYINVLVGLGFSKEMHVVNSDNTVDIYLCLDLINYRTDQIGQITSSDSRIIPITRNQLLTVTLPVRLFLNNTTETLTTQKIRIEEAEYKDIETINMLLTYGDNFVYRKGVDDRNFYTVKYFIGYVDDFPALLHGFRVSKYLYKRPRFTETGVITHGDYRGRGLMYEMKNALLDHLSRIGIKEIYGQVSINNIGYMSLIKKLGYIVNRSSRDGDTVEVRKSLV